MVFFDKEKLTVISQSSEANLSKASLNLDLSAVEYETNQKFFYVTIDKVLFSNPVTTICTVLEAHGFVANLENILSCLDSFVFSIRAKATENPSSNSTELDVSEYLPCVRFELPEKNRIGTILQSFYNEIARHQSQKYGPELLQKGHSEELKSNKSLAKVVEKLTSENKSLMQQVSLLTDQLIAEKMAASQAAIANNSSDLLPANTKICRVEHVDLKRRIVKVKSLKKLIDIPTHMLDRVPSFKSRCLITFDEDDNIPIGILFFDNAEMANLEKRTADLLYVEDDTFKARDSKRNDFQIMAVNPMEQATIKSLRRGMKILISVVDGYIVRFSVLPGTDTSVYKRGIQEQLVVYDIGRNQLANIDKPTSTD